MSTDPATGASPRRHRSQGPKQDRGLLVFLTALAGKIPNLCHANYQPLGLHEGINYTWDATHANRFLPETADDWFDYGDESSLTYTLPWAFTFYGQTYQQITVDTNGSIWFDPGNLANSFPLPTTGPVISAWNNDLSSYYTGGVFLQHKTGPERVVVEWQTETFVEEGYGRQNRFQVVLFADHAIRFNYAQFSTKGGQDFGSGVSDGTQFLSLTERFGPVTVLAGQSFLLQANDSDADGLSDSADNPRHGCQQRLYGGINGGDLPGRSYGTLI